MASVTQIQALLRLLTQDSKLPLAVALTTIKELHKVHLNRYRDFIACTASFHLGVIFEYALAYKSSKSRGNIESGPPNSPDHLQGRENRQTSTQLCEKSCQEASCL